MSTRTFPISTNGNISKYLRVDVGSSRYRRTFFACIDHQVLTPIVKKWQTLPKGKYNPIWPKLVEIIINDNTLVEMNYSDDDNYYESGIAHAMQLADKTLDGINNDNDLFEAILDKNYNEYYPNCVHDQIKVLCVGIISSAEDFTGLKTEIQNAESYFGIELQKKSCFWIMCQKSI